jgi:hypothetical protein
MASGLRHLGGVVLCRRRLLLGRWTIGRKNADRREDMTTLSTSYDA